MATTGAGFLHVTKSDSIGISRHALCRLQEYCGGRFSMAEAFDLFLHGKQVSQQDMLMLGYRPCYERRFRRGQKSWYFRSTVGGEELIAVVGQAPGEMGYTWVTTYSRSAQVEQLATVAFDELAYVA